MPDENKAASPNLTLERTPEYKESYANNVRFESSVWDLKIIFGLLDQSTQPHTVRQFASVNVPWEQAKLMAFFLELNLLFHEHEHGKIKVPSAVMPPSLESFLPKLAEQPGGKELLAKAEELRAKLR